MALEPSVTNISDLNPLWPLGADPASISDDNHRNIKTALLNAFAGFAGSVQVTGVDGGAANAYTLTPTPPLPAYGLKMIAVFAPTVANGGASTLNISGLGVKSLVSVSGAPLLPSELTVGNIYAAFYDGVQFRLTSVTKNYVDQAVVSGLIPAQALGFYRSDGTVSAFTQTHTGYAQNEVKGADIASAATINLTTATGNYLHVTGTTTITGITVPVGADRTIVFDGILTLTHSAALVLPTAANIATAAGDIAVVRGDAAGAVITSYQRANGSPLSTLALLGVSSFYQTPDQTITVDGPLTIAHGLGKIPFLFHGFLKCTSAELGYAVGDITPCQLTASDVNSPTGVCITADATNINVRYGGYVSVFVVIPKTGGGVVNAITPSKWKFFLRVQA